MFFAKLIDLNVLQTVSAPEIQDKLRAFLTRHPLPVEECHVLYLLIELRKVLDQLWPDRKRDFIVVRFYADWSAHPTKDHIAPEIATMADALHDEKTGGLALQRFSQMDALGGELRELFMRLDLSDEWLEQPAWREFVTLLTAILADQPMVSKTAAWRRIWFEPESHTCIIEYAVGTGTSSHV